MDKFKFIDKRKEEINSLKQIIPWAFDDGLINFEKFKEEFIDFSNANYDANLDRYGLYWYGKTLAKNFANLESFKTLKPNKKYSLNFSESNNIIIAGDNLEVLKLLKLNYNNKVDIIYIDPPYNTGNNYIYKDNYSQSIENYKIDNKLLDEDNNYLTTNQKTDGRFHSNWLDMIYPRLLLSRQLLKDDGLIFISIDDNEYARLKLVCDEIFGENNFISTIIWQKTSGSNDSKFLKECTEYVLLYGKSINKVKINEEVKDVVNDKRYKLKDEYFNERGLYRLDSLDNSSHTYSKGMDYVITIDGVNYYPGRDKTKYIERHNGVHTTKDWTWMWSKEKFDRGYKNGFIVVHNGKVKYKIYQYVDNENNSIIKKEKYLNFIPSEKVSNLQGTSEQKKLFDNKVFDHPKPIGLMNYLIKLHTNKNALVLDFFAGSGSTGHSVMDLNDQDGGNRKYILVQLKEQIENSKFNNIIDITRSRIEKAIQKYGYKNEGFKYFELVESNFLYNKIYDLSNNDKENLKLNIESQQKIIKNNIKELDLVYEVGVKNNIFTLDKNIEECYNLGQKYYQVDNDNFLTLFFFHPLKDTTHYGDIYVYIIETIREIYKQYKNIKVYLLDHLFYSDKQKIELCLRIKELSDQINLVVI